jgi:hypothetical protein
MSFRETEIAEHLARWLERYAVPVHLRDKPEASQAEAECLARTLCKFAPQCDYIPFLRQVFEDVDFRMQTRAWPTVHEVGAACSNIRKSKVWALPPAENLDMRPIAIFSRKMKRREPVGEEYLWGIRAVEMIAERLVDEATMVSYREGLFKADFEFYGEEVAIQRKAAAMARHDAAKLVFRGRNEPRKAGQVPIPDKAAKPHPDAA